MESVRKPGRHEFHTRLYVSHGRWPNGAWGLPSRHGLPRGGRYPEIERRPPPSWAVPWQEDGAA